MNLSQKCQYALRATFELARRRHEGAIKISDIASAQAIPPRFLELILNELKQGEFVRSRRGASGGYELAVSPRTLTVGRIIEVIDRPISPLKWLEGDAAFDRPLLGRCAFMDLWQRAREAVTDVYDNTTFEDLIERERAASPAVNYCI